MCRLLNSLVFLNVMYDVGEKTKKGLRVLAYQKKDSEDLELKNLMILTVLFPNTFMKNETKISNMLRSY